MTSDPGGRKTILLFAAFSVFAGISFCFEHIAGVYHNGRHYDALVYNPAVIRGAPEYLYKLDHVRWDETTAYARYVQEILRGEWLGNTIGAYRKYAAGPAPAGPLWWRDRLGPLLVAALAAPLGGDVPRAFILADFVFPALACFTCLLLCHELFSSIAAAVAAASLVIWFSVFDLVGFFYFLWGDPHYGPMFVRTAYPQVSATCTFLLLLALIRAHRRPDGRATAYLAIALALNFYTYVYAWSFAGAAILAWMLLLAIPAAGPMLGPGHSRPRVLVALSCAGAAATLAAFPVWWPLLTRPAAAEDSFLRLGGELTHRPDWQLLFLCGLFLAVSIAANRRDWAHGWFWSVFWLACLIVTNQQVVLGRVIQPFHYWPYFAGLFFLLWVAHIASWRLGAVAPKPVAIAALLAVTGFAQCAYRLAQPMREDRTFHYADSEFQNLLAALRAPALRDCGFLTNDPLLHEILAGHIAQKQLEPWRMDPLSKDEMALIHRVTAEALGHSLRDLPFRLDRSKTLLILNRHRPAPRRLAECQVLFQNSDYIVARLAPCG